MQRSFSPLILIRLFFGGVLNTIGWLFLLFGLLISYVFDIPDTIEGFVNFQGELIEVQGEVAGWEETNFSEDNRDVFKIHFTYKELNGNKYENFSYSKGNALQEGESVIVEYNADNPYYARIKGLRFSKAPIWITFVLIFPAIGLLITFIGLKKGLKSFHLIRTGLLTTGQIKSKENTSIRVNEQAAYKIIFEFRARDGQKYQCNAKMHLSNKLEDEERKRILYDPKNPVKAVLVDDIPVDLKMEGGGYIFSSKGGIASTILNMTIPAAVILVVIYLF